MRPCCPGTTTKRRLPEYWCRCAQLSIRVHRPSDWQDHRRQPCSDDTTVLSRINFMAVADLPAYGYRRVWALLRRESGRDGLWLCEAGVSHYENTQICFLNVNLLHLAVSGPAGASSGS
ncbi:hypothetical protein KCP76_07990 [Salmonella enterica subsp. enterica serovar Weltevreden]|nr:hypothetical protein KCP76_07990 [Salmonella enterica subsp. enterica serovar Weltevreden]